MNGVGTRGRALLAAVAIVAVGLGLRVASFGWNRHIKGDVNLMALTAREYVEHDRLYYPMIYGGAALRPFMTSEPIGTPATQHPPLYPFLAGVLGKLAGTDGTFTLLKWLDELGGLALLAAVLWAGLRRGVAWEWLTTGVLVATAPLLVDYSANGSPYIFSALAVALAILLLHSFDLDVLRDYGLAGLICGLGFQFHSILIGLPLAFVGYWVWQRQHARWMGVGLFVGVIALTLIPWVAWSLSTLGTPLYSTSTDYVLEVLQINSFGQIAEPVVAERYSRFVFGAIKLFLKHGFLEIGPFSLTLSLVGVGFLVRNERSTAWAIGLPTAAYLAVALIWPMFKIRFLVPVLFPLFALAGYGFVHLTVLFPRHERAARVAAWLLLVGSLGWFLPSFLGNPATRHYAPAEEARIAAQYSTMQRLAVEVSQRAPGVMLGYSRMLDSGIETVYWSRLPFVSVGVGTDPDELRARAEQYHVRTIWADTQTRSDVEAAFRSARVILSADPFVVYELPRS